MKILKGNLFFAALLSLAALTSCGTDEDEETTSSSSVSFSAVNTIVEQSCGTSSCHASGAPYVVLVDNQTNFDAYKASIKTRLNSTNASTVMPPSGHTISADDKQTLIDYIDQ